MKIATLPYFMRPIVATGYAYVEEYFRQILKVLGIYEVTVNEYVRKKLKKNLAASSYS